MIYTNKTKQQFQLFSPFPVDFPVPFPYWKDSDIKAVLTGHSGDTELVRDRDYSLTTTAGVNGTLHRLTEWTGAVRLTIYRDVPETQEVDLVDGARLKADLIEKMADRSVALVQQLNEKLNRVAQFPITEPPGGAPVLPPREERAQKFLAFNESGDPISSPGSAAGVALTDYMKDFLSSDNAQAALEKLDAAPYLPTAEEKAALAGTAGMPGSGNPYVTDDDPRLGTWGTGVIGENIDANDVVCIGQDGRIYRASNDDAQREIAIGVAVTQGEYVEGQVTSLTFARTGNLSGFTDLVPAQRYYLGTNGGIVPDDEVPEGAAHILIGYALSDVELQINVGDAKVTVRDIALSGTPTAPTAPAGTNTDQIATTAFISNVINNLLLPVGSRYPQYPNDPTPEELGYPGTWAPWSGRADIYGLSTAQPQNYADYAALAGSTITANAAPLVCYHLTGDDFRLYQFKSRDADYTVPAAFDPVQWNYVQPDELVERRFLQGWEDADFSDADDALYGLGHLILAGDYAGKFVTEIVVPGGKFYGVEGGNRPTFVSGGVQRDRIRNIEGQINAALNLSGFSGALYFGTATSTYGIETRSGTVNAAMLDVSRVVKTGPDVAPANLSIRLWRRVS